MFRFICVIAILGIGIFALTHCGKTKEQRRKEFLEQVAKQFEIRLTQAFEKMGKDLESKAQVAPPPMKHPAPEVHSQSSELQEALAEMDKGYKGERPVEEGVVSSETPEPALQGENSLLPLLPEKFLGIKRRSTKSGRVPARGNRENGAPTLPNKFAISSYQSGSERSASMTIVDCRNKLSDVEVEDWRSSDFDQEKLLRKKKWGQKVSPNESWDIVESLVSYGGYPAFRLSECDSNSICKIVTIQIYVQNRYCVSFTARGFSLQEIESAVKEYDFNAFRNLRD